jgi:hypothetical protein
MHARTDITDYARFSIDSVSSFTGKDNMCPFLVTYFVTKSFLNYKKKEGWREKKLSLPRSGFL